MPSPPSPPSGATRRWLPGHSSGSPATSRHAHLADRQPSPPRKRAQIPIARRRPRAAQFNLGLLKCSLVTASARISHRRSLDFSKPLLIMSSTELCVGTYDAMQRCDEKPSTALRIIRRAGLHQGRSQARAVKVDRRHLGHAQLSTAHATSRATAREQARAAAAVPQGLTCGRSRCPPDLSRSVAKLCAVTVG
jgi:hypothetical protein